MEQSEFVSRIPGMQFPIVSCLFRRRTWPVGRMKSHAAITVELLWVMVLWGGNNAAMKYQLRFWPPVFTASIRFLCAGALLMLVMRWTQWLGKPADLTPVQRRELWTRAGAPLACYITVFVWALHLTTPSSVALFMGTSPVWALIWEERPNRESMHRFIAALLALLGVAVLFLPSLQMNTSTWKGNALALLASVLWTHYSRESRRFSASISGLELTGQSFWRAGALLLPLAGAELSWRGCTHDSLALGLMAYSVILSGLVAFGLWNDALRAWPTSRAFLFGNLIPVTTMLFSHYFLGEPMTSQFWLALALIVGAVVLGQWQPRSSGPGAGTGNSV
ncbi:MAG: DMT family transporter [Verrucomicrobia bacterium]|nr:DMT family transporter [Verrucomicrobiota bacterium]